MSEGSGLLFCDARDPPTMLLARRFEGCALSESACVLTVRGNTFSYRSILSESVCAMIASETPSLFHPHHREHEFKSVANAQDVPLAIGKHCRRYVNAFLNTVGGVRVSLPPCGSFPCCTFEAPSSLSTLACDSEKPLILERDRLCHLYMFLWSCSLTRPPPSSPPAILVGNRQYTLGC